MHIRVIVTWFALIAVQHSASVLLAAPPGQCIPAPPGVGSGLCSPPTWAVRAPWLNSVLLSKAAADIHDRSRPRPLLPLGFALAVTQGVLVAQLLHAVPGLDDFVPHGFQGVSGLHSEA